MVLLQNLKKKTFNQAVLQETLPHPAAWITVFVEP